MTKSSETTTGRPQERDSEQILRWLLRKTDPRLDVRTNRSRKCPTHQTERYDPLPVPKSLSLNLYSERYNGRRARQSSAPHKLSPKRGASPCFTRFAFLCFGIILVLAPAAFGQLALPNGASALQETYQDWRVACSARDKAPACTISQDQSQQNGQRLLAVEMQMHSDGSAVATFLLPFGIVLDSGITPNIDDQPPLTPIRFRTCLPTGCIAQFPLDPATLAKLRTGSRLNLKITADPDKELSFQVSLHGFSAALDRIAALISN